MSNDVRRMRKPTQDRHTHKYPKDEAHSDARPVRRVSCSGLDEQCVGCYEGDAQASCADEMKAGGRRRDGELVRRGLLDLLSSWQESLRFPSGVRLQLFLDRLVNGPSSPPRSPPPSSFRAGVARNLADEQKSRSREVGGEKERDGGGGNVDNLSEAEAVEKVERPEDVWRRGHGLGEHERRGAGELKSTARRAARTLPLPNLDTRSAG